MRFDAYHPLVNLLFFASVVVSTVQFNRPAFAAMGLVCAFLYVLKLRCVRGLVFCGGALAAGALWAVAFAATMHFGVTDIGVTPIGTHYTLEALFCGAVQGMQLAALLMWLNCLVAIFTSDKVEYLLGRVAPRLAMAFALLLRMVPGLNARHHAVARAQAGIGSGPRRGSVGRRTRLAGMRAGALVSWGIDRGAAAQASLVSRGVRLKGRTAYSRYRFDTRDRGVVIVIVLLATVVGVGAALGQTTMQYSPELIASAWTASTTATLVAYAALCLVPWMLQMAGECCVRRSLRR